MYIYQAYFSLRWIKYTEATRKYPLKIQRGVGFITIFVPLFLPSFLPFLPSFISFTLQQLQQISHTAGRYRKISPLPHVLRYFYISSRSASSASKSRHTDLCKQAYGCCYRTCVSKCSAITTIRWAQSNYILQHIHYTHTQYLRARALTHTQIGSNEPPPHPREVGTVHSLWTGPKNYGSILGRLVVHFPKTSGAVPRHAVAAFLYKTVKFDVEQAKKAQRGRKV